jgi:hypothetical protein
MKNKRNYFKHIEAFEQNTDELIVVNDAVCRDRDSDGFTKALNDNFNLDSGLVSEVGQNFVTVTVQGRHYWQNHGFPEGRLYNDPKNAGKLTPVKPPGGNSISRYFALNENEILVFRMPKKNR